MFTPHGHIDGPVGDLAVANLHDDRVDQNHRVDPIEGPVLPGDRVLDHRVSDATDRVAGDIGPVDLGQVCLDVSLYARGMTT